MCMKKLAYVFLILIAVAFLPIGPVKAQSPPYIDVLALFSNDDICVGDNYSCSKVAENVGVSVSVQGFGVLNKFWIDVNGVRVHESSHDGTWDNRYFRNTTKDIHIEAFANATYNSEFWIVLADVTLSLLEDPPQSQLPLILLIGLVSVIVIGAVGIGIKKR